MSAGQKVDVLEVMGVAVDTLAIDDRDTQASRLIKARAAVAELMEKTFAAATAMRVVALSGDEGFTDESWNRDACVAFLRVHADALTAALAKCGGGE